MVRYGVVGATAMSDLRQAPHEPDSRPIVTDKHTTRVVLSLRSHHNTQMAMATAHPHSAKGQLKLGPSSRLHSRAGHAARKGYPQRELQSTVQHRAHGGWAPKSGVASVAGWATAVGSGNRGAVSGVCRLWQQSTHGARTQGGGHDPTEQYWQRPRGSERLRFADKQCVSSCRWRTSA